MKLSTLKYFVDVAEQGNFTKAAQKLYISQPTLSRRIQELEAEIGVELFIRHRHALELSSAGEQFLVEVNDILKRVNQLTHMFDKQETPDESRQLVKIGYLANFNLSKMYELIEEFKASHPYVQFSLKPDTPMNLSDGLSNGAYDLVFNLSTYFNGSKDIEKVPFINNHLQIALPANHKFSHKKKLNFAELKEETVILLERKQSPVIVDYVISECTKHGFNLKANSYVQNLDEGLSMTSVGEGLAFLYSGMNDGTLAEKYHIKIVDLENDSTDQDIVAAIDKPNENELVQELFSFIKSYLN
ncbi:LysR family transcriptional regulator [Listeria seeligeri]|uniref:LysR family transcriptional regulator n=1 Tax=Listeria seeligeri TaxID=1640 RepID=UPI0016244AF8|nr:LysR family transcriptional regulator [Listeria seeligeri]MBC1421465.1 LysR family transcriptional regulator [Listeria seeligeri]MBC1424236.1 LysR family transcriptional regulator [Listeria seeligeri]MBC1430557.1 LysR family transcriptional regulator [Listeria seeligeri]MBC1442877.1 LysR family transcriptional regulator [Listeria seeligeri]MBC1472563.1 LysR family transcriptional regulator [Listeria seeligeri]